MCNKSDKGYSLPIDKGDRFRYNRGMHWSETIEIDKFWFNIGHKNYVNLLKEY